MRELGVSDELTSIPDVRRLFLFYGDDMYGRSL
jgi:hypothetical protein